MTISTLAVLPSSQTSDQKSRDFYRRDLIPLMPEVLWKIESGIVRTMTWNQEGNQISLGYWGVGDVIGQPLSRLDPFQVECVTSVRVSLIPPQEWSHELGSILSHIQQAQELHSIVQTQSTDLKLLNFLNWLAKKFGNTTELGLLIDVRLTHLEIADVIGITRVSVTRMMQKLERKGIILRPRRHCIILKSAQ
ncbi:Crp/Fnr family transcriptional regulator [Lyngbya sp. PCC 8106]|uniref:Crp/Fnr family transcriptional regulator n=1 Tax=Lyngbya sp. (strain PCC 8106) TaxID=313612 RepID=UPI0000EA972D|nr:Crp/Fnr family transcriptional regulator [Lyngbya sp. PCC 8106]EAW34206.1 Possible Transcriptional Regulator, Crp/Fnr family protein [Lyngbya sp. PCC 8106]